MNGKVKEINEYTRLKLIERGFDAETGLQIKQKPKNGTESYFTREGFRVTMPNVISNMFTNVN